MFFFYQPEPRELNTMPMNIGKGGKVTKKPYKKPAKKKK